MSIESNDAMAPIRRLMDGDQFSARNDIRLISVAPGHAVAALDIHEYHWNGLKSVQGGAIFTLADFAFAAAANAHGTVAVAVNVSISFLKAAKTGTLTAEAREVSRQSRLGTYSVEVRDDQGELVATFQGMVYRKPDRILPSGEPEPRPPKPQ